ncbi:hypothetical protein LENED_006452 [Lentinula edodes]|uniref:Uncharacterized protein n=1 Tax=Lentinula edodes TaxID=5353 RepID=A0A1Q3EBP0_LENED|nr:hypothetical protein LENED_006452 [Lentinula edodes]
MILSVQEWRWTWKFKGESSVHRPALKLTTSSKRFLPESICKRHFGTFVSNFMSLPDFTSMSQRPWYSPYAWLNLDSNLPNLNLENQHHGVQSPSPRGFCDVQARICKTAPASPRRLNFLAAVDLRVIAQKAQQLALPLRSSNLNDGKGLGHEP